MVGGADRPFNASWPNFDFQGMLTQAEAEAVRIESGTTTPGEASRRLDRGADE